MLDSNSIVWETGSILASRVTSDGVLERSFEADLPVEVRFVRRRRPGFPLHWHDYFQLAYIESGEALYQVRNRAVVVRQGDLFVLNGTLHHRMRKCLRPELREIQLDFQPELISDDHSTGEDRMYLTPFLTQDEDFPHVVTAASGVPAEVLELIRRVHAELPARTNRSRLVVKTCVKMILALLVNHYAPVSESSDAFQSKEREFERLKPLLEFVAHNYREPITVGDGAAILHMSRPHFMRLFRHTMGETFVTYLNRVRIAKAEALLASTNKSVAEVGLEAGFKDQSYFGQVFRRLVNVTPRQYRSNLQQSH